MINQDAISAGRTLLILVADDDPDDRAFAEDALRQANINNDLAFVNDGIELLEYLKRTGDYTELSGTPLPSLILLDLNMPRMDGYQSLREIKNDPELQKIPIVVMTTSDSPTDVRRAYNLGSNSFVVKPAGFHALVELMRGIVKYWFQTVELPPVPGSGSAA